MTNENNNTSLTQETGINRQLFKEIISNLPEEDQKHIGEFSKEFKNDTAAEILKVEDKDKIKAYDKKKPTEIQGEIKDLEVKNKEIRILPNQTPIQVKEKLTELENKSLEQSDLDRQELVREKEKVVELTEQNNYFLQQANRILESMRFKRYVLDEPVITINQAQEKITKLLERKEKELEDYLNGEKELVNKELDFELSIYPEKKKLFELWSGSKKYNKENDFADGSLELSEEQKKVIKKLTEENLKLEKIVEKFHQSKENFPDQIPQGKLKKHFVQNISTNRKKNSDSLERELNNSRKKITQKDNRIKEQAEKINKAVEILKNQEQNIKDKEKIIRELETRLENSEPKDNHIYEFINHLQKDLELEKKAKELIEDQVQELQKQAEGDNAVRDKELQELNEKVNILTRQLLEVQEIHQQFYALLGQVSNKTGLLPRTQQVINKIKELQKELSLEKELDKYIKKVFDTPIKDLEPVNKKVVYSLSINSSVKPFLMGDIEEIFPLKNPKEARKLIKFEDDEESAVDKIMTFIRNKSISLAQNQNLYLKIYENLSLPTGDYKKIQEITTEELSPFYRESYFPSTTKKGEISHQGMQYPSQTTETITKQKGSKKSQEQLETDPETGQSLDDENGKEGLRPTWYLEGSYRFLGRLKNELKKKSGASKDKLQQRIEAMKKLIKIYEKDYEKPDIEFFLDKLNEMEGFEEYKNIVGNYFVNLLNPTATPFRPKSIILVGHAGTGKSAIANKTAEASKRAFFRLPLGGVKEPVYLKGMDAVYGGADQGTILKMTLAKGSCQGIILCDEFEKAGSRAITDIIGSMTDPDQNSFSFEDDRSQVINIPLLSYGKRLELVKKKLNKVLDLENETKRQTLANIDNLFLGLRAYVLMDNPIDDLNNVSEVKEERLSYTLTYENSQKIILVRSFSEEKGLDGNVHSVLTDIPDWPGGNPHNEQEERKKITFLDLSNQELYNFDFSRYPELEELDISNNNFDKLDLSNNLKLKFLNLSFNEKIKFEENLRNRVKVEYPTWQDLEEGEKLEYQSNNSGSDYKNAMREKECADNAEPRLEHRKKIDNYKTYQINIDGEKRNINEKDPNIKVRRGILGDSFELPQSLDPSSRLDEPTSYHILTCNLCGKSRNKKVEESDEGKSIEEIMGSCPCLKTTKTQGMIKEFVKVQEYFIKNNIDTITLQGNKSNKTIATIPKLRVAEEYLRRNNLDSLNSSKLEVLLNSAEIIKQIENFKKNSEENNKFLKETIKELREEVAKYNIYTAQEEKYYGRPVKAQIFILASSIVKNWGKTETKFSEDIISNLSYTKIKKGTPVLTDTIITVGKGALSGAKTGGPLGAFAGAGLAAGKKFVDSAFPQQQTYFNEYTIEQFEHEWLRGGIRPISITLKQNKEMLNRYLSNKLIKNAGEVNEYFTAFNFGAMLDQVGFCKFKFHTLNFHSKLEIKENKAIQNTGSRCPGSLEMIEITNTVGATSGKRSKIAVCEKKEDMASAPDLLPWLMDELQKRYNIPSKYLTKEKNGVKYCPVHYNLYFFSSEDYSDTESELNATHFLVSRLSNGNQGKIEIEIIGGIPSSALEPNTEPDPKEPEQVIEPDITIHDPGLEPEPEEPNEPETEVTDPELNEPAPDPEEPEPNEPYVEPEIEIPDIDDNEPIL
nr:5786_t:CDS:10 [Entrophospora candida]